MADPRLDSSFGFSEGKTEMLTKDTYVLEAKYDQFTRINSVLWSKANIPSNWNSKTHKYVINSIRVEYMKNCEWIDLGVFQTGQTADDKLDVIREIKLDAPVITKELRIIIEPQAKLSQPKQRFFMLGRAGFNAFKLSDDKMKALGADKLNDGQLEAAVRGELDSTGCADTSAKDDLEKQVLKLTEQIKKLEQDSQTKDGDQKNEVCPQQDNEIIDEKSMSRFFKVVEPVEYFSWFEVDPIKEPPEWKQQLVQKYSKVYQPTLNAEFGFHARYSGEGENRFSKGEPVILTADYKRACRITEVLLQKRGDHDNNSLVKDRLLKKFKVEAKLEDTWNEVGTFETGQTVAMKADHIIHIGLPEPVIAKEMRIIIVRSDATDPWAAGRVGFTAEELGEME